MTRITLPWPPKGLHAHAKGHWRSKAAATKSYRAIAFWLAKEAKVAADPNARLVFTFHPPNLRRRDLPNLFGPPTKAAIDGIAEAMGCDDNRFRCAFPEEFAAPVKGGAVIIEVET